MIFVRKTWGIGFVSWNPWRCLTTLMKHAIALIVFSVLVEYVSGKKSFSPSQQGQRAALENRGPISAPSATTNHSRITTSNSYDCISRIRPIFNDNDCEAPPPPCGDDICCQTQLTLLQAMRMLNGSAMLWLGGVLARIPFLAIWSDHRPLSVIIDKCLSGSEYVHQYYNVL